MKKIAAKRWNMQIKACKLKRFPTCIFRRITPQISMIYFQKYFRLKCTRLHSAGRNKTECKLLSVLNLQRETETRSCISKRHSNMRQKLHKSKTWQRLAKKCNKSRKKWKCAPFQKCKLKETSKTKSLRDMRKKWQASV